MWVSGFATLLVALQLRRFLGVVWVLLGKVPTAIRLIRKTTTAGLNNWSRSRVCFIGISLEDISIGVD